MNAVQRVIQGLGTEGSEMLHGPSISQPLNEVLALSHGQQHSCLMNDSPVPTCASLLLTTHVVDRKQACDVPERHMLLDNGN